ncbi:MAG: hypothetical protein UHU19_17160 [Lachnospiraceae bacterium]|nr:hypothetical protein [Lachnospiraceae bacterium]
MKEQKNESKDKLFMAIFYAISAMILGILAVVDFISKRELPSLIHIGLILVWGVMAINNFVEYRKNKRKTVAEQLDILETNITRVRRKNKK